MKKFFLGLLALLAPMNSGVRVEIPSLEPTVVQIDAGCSGFIGFQGVVITASHCVEGADEHYVTFYDGVRENFKVIARGEADHRDFALLTGNTRGLDPVRYAASPPVDNTPCVVIGHGGGNPRQLGSYCVVQGPDSEFRGYIELSATIIPGDSGSAVRLLNGEVFAIAVRSAMPYPVGLAVPIAIARKAYADWLKKQK
jgi:S1-C subfamily serine protease